MFGLLLLAVYTIAILFGFAMFANGIAGVFVSDMFWGALILGLFGVLMASELGVI